MSKAATGVVCASVLAGLAGFFAARKLGREKSSRRKRAGCSDGVAASYLIVHNIAKRTNIGNIIRSCSAFGVSAVLVAGRKKSTTFYGSKGTKNHVNIRYFNELHLVKEFCHENGIRVCGIEIMDNADPVHTHPWVGSTAFILGNEGTGLTEKEKAICDSFVYVQHRQRLSSPSSSFVCCCRTCGGRSDASTTIIFWWA